MAIPFTTAELSLPEELGIISNVRAIVTTCDKTIHINCEHYTRFYSPDGLEWPDTIFDENMSVVIGFKIIENNEPNSSVFRGDYFIYDESYLEGDIYFIFDFYKDEIWYRNYSTSSSHFVLDADSYRDILEPFKD